MGATRWAVFCECTTTRSPLTAPTLQGEALRSHPASSPNTRHSKEGPWEGPGAERRRVAGPLEVCPPPPPRLSCQTSPLCERPLMHQETCRDAASRAAAGRSALPGRDSVGGPAKPCFLSRRQEAPIGWPALALQAPRIGHGALCRPATERNIPIVQEAGPPSPLRRV